MDGSKWNVLLSERLLERLAVEVTDEGSVAHLVREVQGRIVKGVLSVEPAFVDLIAHDAYVYGRGPWQLLLREILAEIDAASSYHRGRGRDTGVRESTPIRRPRARPRRVLNGEGGGEWRALLSEGLLSRLSEEVTESGSFPELVRDIQRRVIGSELTVDGTFVEKIAHDAYVFGRGPWQLLLRDVLDEIDAAAACSP